MILLSSQNNNNSVSEGNDVYDIISLQETITKHFSNTAISVPDEMEIDLFQILKASNALLIFFYKCINWVRKNEGNIK